MLKVKRDNGKEICITAREFGTRSHPGFSIPNEGDVTKHLNDYSVGDQVCLIALIIFQAYLFKNERIENGFQTAYGSNLTANEESKMFSIGSSFLLATIPWMIPFIFFFQSFVKILSIIVYIIGLIGGLLLYRMKNKKNIIKRIQDEEIERQEQENKEQLGKWK